PHAPVPEQSPAKANDGFALAGANAQRRDEVGHDMIVIAGIERNALLRPGRYHAEGNIERLVAIEGGDLDCNHVLYGGKARPEGPRKRDTANRGLQVEADQWRMAGDGGAVLDDLILARALHGTQTQQDRMVSEGARGLRLVHGLFRPAG